MCTAISFLTKDHYFGRNLDLEYSYNETVTITPRNFPLVFRHKETLKTHYAMIGMAYIQDNYPLYYDATNEKGLSMAGLNFPENADYKPFSHDKDNITPFEFIPWILAQCQSLEEVKLLLTNINLINEDFNTSLPLTPLHWIISDRAESITVESMKTGFKIHSNPLGVLTNNPPFDQQMSNWNQYNSKYCPSMLPGDLSSESRFIRAACLKHNSICGGSEKESVSQFFHFLSSLEYVRGCQRTNNDSYKITVYSSCCNTDLGIYYYKTYDNSQICGVNMHHEDLEGNQLVSYPLITMPQYRLQN